jgi:hypothetical protein
MKREAFFEWANLVVCVSRQQKGSILVQEREREEKIFFWHQITFLECPAARSAPNALWTSGEARVDFCVRAQRDASQLFFLIRCVGWLAGCMGRRARPVIIYSLPLAREIYARTSSPMRQLLPPKTGMRSQRAVNKFGSQRKITKQVPKETLRAHFSCPNICWSDLKKK